MYISHYLHIIGEKFKFETDNIVPAFEHRTDYKNKTT